MYINLFRAVIDFKYHSKKSPNIEKERNSDFLTSVFDTENFKWISVNDSQTFNFIEHYISRKFDTEQHNRC